ncbi:MAG: permease [Planctomycetota bacterium]
MLLLGAAHRPGPASGWGHPRRDRRLPGGDPETGPDSVGVTFGLFDPLFALFRPLAAWVSALVTGFLVDRTRGGGAEAPAAACDGDHCHDHGGEHEHGHAETTRGGWAATLRYAFVDLWQDVAPALTLGFVAGGLFGAALPADVLEKWVPAGLLGLIVVGLFGIPLSICATASTPLAAALVDRGLSPGAALVLLLTGPATNLATLALVRQMLGGRGLAAYLAGIFGTALAGGLLVDGWYRGRDGVLRGGLELAEHSHQAPWEWAAGGLLLVLFAVFWASRGWRSLEKRRVG